MDETEAGDDGQSSKVKISRNRYVITHFGSLGLWGYHDIKWRAVMSARITMYSIQIYCCYQ